jgi:hypothetical protein
MLGICGYNRTIIEGTFYPASAAISTTYTQKGKGWTVAYTSTGLFTITLVDLPAQIDSVIATLQLATAAARFMQVGTVTTASKTIQLRVVDNSGVVQNVAENANNSISFTVITRSGAEI